MFLGALGLGLLVCTSMIVRGGGWFTCDGDGGQGESPMRRAVENFIAMVGVGENSVCRPCSRGLYRQWTPQ